MIFTKWFEKYGGTMEELLFYDQEEEWNQALLLYKAVLKEVCTKLEILNDEFKLAHQYNPIEHISSRIKSMHSIARKMRLKQKELTVENIIRYINDVAGVRIICSFTSDIYRIASAIAKQDDVTILKVKDYIAEPKPNGYTSYHMIVSIPIFLSNDVIHTKVEIQIRTIAMDFWASLEHKIYYKFEGKAPDSIRDELRECANIVSFLDQKMLSINENVKNYYNDFNGGSTMTSDSDIIIYDSDDASEQNTNPEDNNYLNTFRMSDSLKSLFGSVSVTE